MRVVVGLAVCQGYAQCAFLAPDVFRLSGPEGLMYEPNPPDNPREKVLRAIAACPVKAISTDAPGPDGRGAGGPDERRAPRDARAAYRHRHRRRRTPGWRLTLRRTGQARCCAARST